MEIDDIPTPPVKPPKQENIKTPYDILYETLEYRRDNLYRESADKKLQGDELDLVLIKMRNAKKETLK